MESLTQYNRDNTHHTICCLNYMFPTIEYFQYHFEGYEIDSPSVLYSLPGGSDGKASAWRCGRPGCDPWRFPWIRKGQPIPVPLPGKSHGRRSLVGYSLWGHKESDMSEELHFSFPVLYCFYLFLEKREIVISYWIYMLVYSPWKNTKSFLVL